MVTSEFVRQYGLKTYPCAPEKFLAINGQALVTESACDFRMQMGGKNSGLVLHLKGVRVLTTHDIRFVIGVDVMYGSEHLKPMVVDYSGKVTLFASKPGVKGRDTCELVVPEQYRRELPPAPPRPSASTSLPAPPRQSAGPPQPAPPKQPAGK